MSKRVLCLDFDGVIHLYGKGWHDGSIYDGVTPGFFPWLHSALELFDVVVYSSRSKTQSGVDAMNDWLNFRYQEFLESDEAEGGIFIGNLLDFVRFAHEKPPAFITIDDRALTFTGNWADFDPEKLRDFKPWNVKKPAEQADAPAEAKPYTVWPPDTIWPVASWANGEIELAACPKCGGEGEYDARADVVTCQGTPTTDGCDWYARGPKPEDEPTAKTEAHQ